MIGISRDIRGERDFNPTWDSKARATVLRNLAGVSCSCRQLLLIQDNTDSAPFETMPGIPDPNH